MRFRSLTLSAIGPFPGTHTIDFDVLTASRIFLFDGPTGSGKSSIIDALVFALYGTVAGNESDPSRIRSIYADLGTESYVDLIFTIASGTYRVRRSPKWIAQKKRGEGTIQRNEKATLWRLGNANTPAEKWDADNPIATSVKSVNIAISEEIGLNRHQFVQTVILPQGQFAEFLRLSSTDRSKLLETLFDTSAYSAFTKRLEEQSKHARGEIERAAHAVHSAIHAWCGIDGMSEDFPEIASIELIDSQDHRASEAIEEAHRHIQERASTARQEANRQRALLTAATTRYQSAVERDAALREREQLQASHANLTAHKDQIAEYETALSRHEHAALADERLRVFNSAHSNLTATFDQFHSAYDDLRHSATVLADLPLPSALTQLASEIAGQDMADITVTSAPPKPLRTQTKELHDLTEEYSQTVNARLAQVQELCHRESEIAKLHTDVAQLNEKLSECQKQIEYEEERLSQLPTKIADVQNRLDHARATAAQLDQLLLQEKAGKERLELFTQCENAQQTTAEMRDALAAALEQHNEYHEQVTELTRNWTRSIACELALELHEGSPCPVCGSTDHPQPATPTDQSVTREEVRQAQERLENYQQAVTTAQLQHQNAHTRWESLKEQLGEVNQDELRSQQQAIAEQITSAQQAKSEITELNTQLTEYTEALDKAREQAHAAREERSTWEARIASLQEAIASGQQQIDAALGAAQSLEEYANHLQALTHDTRELLRCVSALNTGCKQLIPAQADAQIALADAELTAEQVRRARLAPETAREYQNAIRRHYEELAAVTAQLTSERLRNLDDGEDLDLEQCTKERDTAQQHDESAQRNAVRYEQRAADSQRLAQDVTNAIAHWQQAERDAGPIVRLASLAAAELQTGNRVRLNVWVLLRRFEQIVERANEHLLAFSYGKYELRRSDEVSGERKSGLGLTIIQHNNNGEESYERPARSLSGGETFYTSLALALALSEVVQAENGGIRIETLLIDEGFGTLSDAYLSAVMDTLSTLRAHGRTVGIISHVDELKQAIMDRVSVEPLASGGSTLRVPHIPSS
ncbi:AAA family ATPase [Trueperella sp. LYQ143]|uniref:AAA family ATPase n=1 Tax=Trueperella sp. LYQ143 TaxID=3391059 RepID=UPI003983419E